MGLIKHLLFWPVTGPLFLTEFSMNKVQGVVREELTDDTRIKAELMELQLKLELGDIDDDQYVAYEADLMRQLREIREWREQFGMGVSGGPVRVQASRPDESVEPDDSADVVDEDEARAAQAEDDVNSRDAGRKPQVADPSGGVDIDLNLDWD
ncbi:MAG TPA: gas vesicle protein GvpG [Longimicrobiales bacterium]|nr:gas vesicle protein GvpG [Longimicrobiales bacterium]